MANNNEKNYTVPTYPEPYWRESIHIPEFPKLEESIHADIGIVGGGITGITTAYLLVKAGLKVALIDAGRLLNGTTGHTTAKVTAQHGLIYDELIQHIGEEKAKLYYEACTEAMDFIQERINEHNISCDFSIEDAYVYTNSDRYISKIESEKKAYDKLGIKGEITKEIPFDIPIKSAIVMKNQAQFHPLKYLKTLVDYMKENGGLIYENTTAIDVANGDHPNILTREGYRITCDRVVAASHYPFYGGEGYYFSRMYPERSYIIAIDTDKKFPGGMYINAEDPTRSIRSTTLNGKELWLIGGDNHKTGQGKSTIEHYEALEQFANETFGIKNYQYRWSAQDLTTLDKVPFIGQVTEDQPEVLIATGFRKWGMTNGTIAAKLLADIITSKENKYRSLYSPSRFHADPDIKKFSSINADVAKHLIKGKLEYTTANIDDVNRDEAKVVRINGRRAGVYRDNNGEPHIVDTTCTHMGCEVNWNAGDRTWDCPCHGSRFNINGEVVEGPAQQPLKKYNNEYFA
ncbi:FAD-dependent oxidoreductase [Aquibacillus albus]|uniref:Glycine/D-amino acid oxidase-like deaminating enzyme/nitrite reductase/ring-hydroxylating ferredoxin subunit n=1 Tax=Aquibacillus albus TaxID=1168171 RepID=A0ABS2MVH2_9BACI|nr:FAD-dependent oxidoreductase [Aquibacillus albus]MBM7569899.1 glycine/D-amino acid oxidase-like deaminating enzyme/nitrite reductase/ring-hydroxylating ferredoxin subunit [Aquibacillus albus]